MFAYSNNLSGMFKNLKVSYDEQKFGNANDEQNTDRGDLDIISEQPGNETG